jgi:hypothetical protein
MPEAKDPTPMAAPNFMEMPGFQEAVAAGVASVLAGMSLPGQAQPVVQDQAFFDRLAMGIATLAQQGSGQVYVSPAVMQAREEARDRMYKLIEEAIAEDRPATYMLTARIQLFGEMGPEIIEPLWQDRYRVTQPTIIDWPGEPSDAMKPMNETAEAIFEAWKASIGNLETYEPKKKIALSARGRVVSGAAVKPQMERDDPFKRAEEANEKARSRFKLHHAQEPGGRTVEKHILGTIHPPASFQV